MFTGQVLPARVQQAIIRAARNMIDHHGARAAKVAQLRGDNLFACGRYDTAETWKQIAAAIGELQRRAASASRQTPHERAAQPDRARAGTLPVAATHSAIGE